MGATDLGPRTGERRGGVEQDGRCGEADGGAGAVPVEAEAEDPAGQRESGEEEGRE